ncbi:glycosyltransferase [Bacillus sp. Marseille-P3661]|uniref:glycosyltransferase n=1 Tax=Bacillus sp. Marseille-P3661 TaxID=1936234 RepID=UPI000C85D7AC|nr:glycosyltransferase [Bacillus sp. Marseille-P3661]
MKKKLLFIIPSLSGGGAERVIVTLLKRLSREKFDMKLVLLVKEGTYLKEIPNDIEIINLNVQRVRSAVYPLLSTIWKVKPDVIFSTLGHLNLALILLKFLFPKKSKLVVREGSIVSRNILANKFPKIWALLYKYFYKNADLIICQSQFMRDDLMSNFNVPSKKMHIIYNPVDITVIEAKSNQDPRPSPMKEENVNIIAIGRLSQEKGYERIIEAFPNLLEKKPNSKLFFLGMGPKEQQLKEKCRSMGIQESVQFIGFQENPYVWLKYADLFIISSYYEGLPNVLLEAIACKCPSVSLVHPGGTREIFELTGQENRFVNNLSWEEEWFSKPQEDIVNRLAEHFGVTKIIAEYTKVFDHS